MVLVVVSGRPLAHRMGRSSTAPLSCSRGSRAMRDPTRSPTSFTGAVDPGGKLPVSMPRHVGQVPLTYRHHPTGGRSNWKGDYVDGPAARSGRSDSAARTPRSSSQTSGGRPDGDPDRRTERSSSGWTWRTAATARATRWSSSTVRDEEATVARPVLELRGFRRVTLEPGERRTVSFRLAAEQFAYTGAATAASSNRAGSACSSGRPRPTCR